MKEWEFSMAIDVWEMMKFTYGWKEDSVNDNCSGLQLTATCTEIKVWIGLFIWGNQGISVDGIISGRKFSAENELKHADQERVAAYRRHRFPMESRNLWTVGPNALKSKKKKRCFLSNFVMALSLIFLAYIFIQLRSLLNRDHRYQCQFILVSFSSCKAVTRHLVTLAPANLLHTPTVPFLFCLIYVFTTPHHCRQP